MSEVGFTNTILAENEILKKKLEYIDELIDEYKHSFLNQTSLCKFLDNKDLVEVFSKITAICKNKTCNNCKWTAIDPYDKGMRCVNADSDNCTEWVDNNESCPYYEKPEFIWVKTCLACPEQYDIYKNKEKVAYVRERHGHLSVEVIDLGNPIIFEIDNINDNTVMDYRIQIEDAIRKYK